MKFYLWRNGRRLKYVTLYEFLRIDIRMYYDEDTEYIINK